MNFDYLTKEDALERVKDIKIESVIQRSYFNLSQDRMVAEKL